MNGDKQLDLVVSSTDGTMHVLIGNQQGSFAAATDYPAASANIPLAADVTGDKSIDIVVADGRAVSILTGKGDGTFQPRISYPTGAGAIAAASADLDSDGQPDLIIANRDESSISVLSAVCLP